MDNEESTIHIVANNPTKRDRWRAVGKKDGLRMEVELYIEDREAFQNAGYCTDKWDGAMTVSFPDVSVLTMEDNGRRRVAAVCKRGTEDDWIEVERKR